jgi:DNA-binding GntR family transcriptional regulator
MIVQPHGRTDGVSATPIREPLLELASIGIVDSPPNQRRAREFGPTQLREIYQLRRLLEVEAVQGPVRISTTTVRQPEAIARANSKPAI